MAVADGRELNRGVVLTEQHPPRVFISYSHDTIEHQERVLALADRLRADGVDAEVDQYNAAPPEGWPLWCEQQIDAADVVLMICTETYHRRVKGCEEQGKGLGVVWEARIIRQLLYDAGAISDKFVPVLFSDASPEQIPTPIKGWTRYVVDTEDGYEELYRRLTGQPRLLRPALGTIRPLPTRTRQWPESTMEAASSSPAPAKVEADEAAGVDRELAEAIDTLGEVLQRVGSGLTSPLVARRSSAKAIRLWALGMPVAQMYSALPSIHALIEEYDPAGYDEDIVQLAEVVCTQFRDIMAGVIGMPRRGLNCSVWLRALSPDNADASQTVVSPLAFSDPFDGRPVVPHKAYESSIAAALSGLKDSAGNDWFPQQSHCFCCNNLPINEFTTSTMNWRRFFKSVLAFPIRKRGRRNNRALKDYGYLRFDAPEVGLFDNMPCAFQYKNIPWQYSSLLDERPEFYLGGMMARLLLLALDKPSAGLDEVSNAA